ncbi:MAG: proline dehydrogenase family protein [Actinobacteria bacterium]|nr:proline dehydrogenase family protein [Actinomycetota bacterium]
MLRKGLIAVSQSEALRNVAENTRPARAVAMRFVAGETLDDGIRVARTLNAKGMAVSLDELGESVEDEDVARRAATSYRDTLGRMDAEDIDGNISVKLTALGLEISPDLTRELVAGICTHAAELGRHVTVDMEGSDHTAATIALVLALREDGHDNVGCAVQSYLHRTADDVAQLVEASASLRLCKGAYAEPPEIAYQSDREVDANYARLAETLLQSGTYPRIATHDHVLIHEVKNLAARFGLDRGDFEFQMLYGVRERLQEELVADGYRLRVYVPFGPEWYPYFMRRIAERPANVTFFLRALRGQFLP